MIQKSYQVLSKYINVDSLQMNSLIVFGTRLANIFTVSFKSNLNYLVFKVASRGIHNLLRTSNLFMYEILTDTQIYRWDEN